MGRPTTDDKQLSGVLIQTGIAILIFIIILTLVLIWMFSKMLPPR